MNSSNNKPINDISSFQKPLPKFVQKNLDDNISLIRQQFSNTDDLIIREVHKGSERYAVLYIENIVEIEKLQKFILTINQKSDQSVTEFLAIQANGSSEIGRIEKNLLSGSCIIFIEGCDLFFAQDISNSKERAVTEPENEKTVQGAHDGFIENLSTNLYLLRKRLQSSKLNIKYFPVGEKIKTKVALTYLIDLTNEEIIVEVERRLKNISMEMVLNMSFLEELIEDSSITPFPQILNTERVDRVIGHLNEGRIALFIEGNPTALILPVTFSAFYQSPDDYNSRWLMGTFIRAIRHASFLISILLPAYYIAVIGFHFEVLPDELVSPVGSSIENIPFPPLIEALFMELTIELIREAGIRLPSRIGQTIGIVGGLVIGDAIVQAGLISTTMIVVVALTAISSYSVPSHGMSDAVRLLRFPFMLLASSFGFIGISFGFIVVLAHLCKLESFGTPYFAPFAPFRMKDLKDTFMRLPIWKMNTRPLDPKPKDMIQSFVKRGWKYGQRKKR
ncbi:spore germination protein [Metabacillus halosaccharovorans]|uniref:spore germination protein n=1 Tax=Metabacillus halosaccharovorans TaxID=930124 RepID=UPI0009951FD8|nr:spore germination protein [Metabacillus halosaccharovorans]